MEFYICKPFSRVEHEPESGVTAITSDNHNNTYAHVAYAFPFPFKVGVNCDCVPLSVILQLFIENVVNNRGNSAIRLQN